jgi:hypothetical protein
METGLVQNREEFILPNDAYPILENAFVWRERIKRKQGYELLGRLRRVYTLSAIGVSGASPWTFNLFTSVAPPILESAREIEVGSVIINIGATQLIDQGDGTLATSPVSGVTGVINYISGVITITGNAGGVATTATFNYFPGLPVMGLRSRELDNINNEQLVAFDTVYAYKFGASGWEEFIPGTIWSGNDSDFFWSTNYWVGDNDNKIFWVTNFSGPTKDPMRYTNGTAWVDFAPTIDSVGNKLNQCLAMLPFRGRLVTFNTWEGMNLAASVQQRQRIRWAAIGNPFNVASAIVSTPSPDAWRDDIRGKGGFLDIPTAEDIVAVGFVRDNLVIYCERSTWQLRYTGRSIAPFQIEKVNTELGAESTFSAVQFDTSLVGIGDKGVVECDSYKSERIDIKIPDLVFFFNNDANGPKRVHGIRDFQQRLAYWTYPYKPDEEETDIFPNRRLVYNYENDSWAIFTDSLTTLGTYQPQSGRRWQDYTRPTIDTWQNQNYSWINRPSLFPAIVGGNQQGFVEFLDSQVKNDVSLTIANITGNGILPTDLPVRINSPSHNLETGQVIEITNIVTTDQFVGLNDGIYGVDRVDNDNIDLSVYSSITGDFSDPALATPGTYLGGGRIAVIDNFRVVSKKFNFLDDGQAIQFGFVDVLMNTTTDGAITLNVYIDYNNNEPVNIIPQNQSPDTNAPDTFFNSVVPTSSPGGIDTSKAWQRVFCAARGSFVTLEWTLSNLQMIGPEQESDVQIDAQILWMRPAGRQLPQGF